MIPGDINYIGSDRDFGGLYGVASLINEAREWVGRSNWVANLVFLVAGGRNVEVRYII